ncbi:DUF6115 domain-containing protein [Bacillus solitudinis]|uniref:DUF6115 domain-containing protein n=1 Tax=Bacillus solitudinis TaxID=2014074 RepID=UPI000C24316A|nr:hypothetical protein [Bacillus solitudinis]
MTTYLTVISLIFHGVTFLWILTLMQRNSKFEDEKKEMLKMKADIEETLFSYTNEMKESNEQVLKEIKFSLSQSENQQKKMKVKKTFPPQNKKPTVRENPVIKDPSEDYEQYVPPIPEQKNEEVIYEQSDTSKVLAMAKQGIEVEMIAKKLNLGKGEVELMLKFYR